MRSTVRQTNVGRRRAGRETYRAVKYGKIRRPVRLLQGHYAPTAIALLSCDDLLLSDNPSVGRQVHEVRGVGIDFG